MIWLRFFAVLKKEFIQMRRDRLTFAFMIGLPLMEMILFGYAIQTTVKHTALAVYDEARCLESRRLTGAFEASGYFRVSARVTSYPELREAVRDGRAGAGLHVPEDFLKRLRRGEPASVELIADAADPLTASSVLNSGGGIAAAFGGDVHTLTLRSRPWYNPELKSATFIVPGILGIVLMITTMVVTGVSVVREKERGTLEQLIATPVRRSELVFGKITAYILFGYAQVVLMVGLARLLFDVPIRGSFPLFLVMCFPFILTNLGLGLFFSTIAKTQQESMQSTMFLFLPSILLSGFIFPVSAMPFAARLVSYILPMTYFLRIVRGIFLKNQGWFYLHGSFWALCAFAAFFIGLSMLRFQKKLG